MEENNLQILNAIKDSTNKIIEEIRVNSDLVIKENQLNSIRINDFSEKQKNTIIELKEQYYELKEQNKYGEAQEKIQELVNTIEDFKKVDETPNVTITPMYQIEVETNYYTLEVSGTITNNDSRNLENIIVDISVYSFYDDVRVATIKAYMDKLNAGETALLSGSKFIRKSLVDSTKFKYKVEIVRFWYE